MGIFIIIAFVLILILSIVGLYKYLRNNFYKIKNARKKGTKFFFIAILKLIGQVAIMGIAISLIKYAVIGVIVVFLAHTLTSQERMYGDEFYM